MTAAMCQGNKLEKVRDDFPDRFFDVGICEIARGRLRRRHGQGRHAADRGHLLARSCSARSTRSSRRCALQNLPVVFTLDRAGLTGPDGPTHHGVLRHRRTCGCSRTWSCMAPGDELDVAPMLRLRPGARRPDLDALPEGEPGEGRARRVAPIELGQAEVIEWGEDGVLRRLRHAAVRLRARRRRSCAAEGLDVGVINARFCKPLDKARVLRAVEEAASW